MTVLIELIPKPVRLESKHEAYRFPSLKCPSGAMAAQPICNWQVGGFESPLGLHLLRLKSSSQTPKRRLRIS